MHGPFEIEVKVHVAVGENIGVVTYSMPVGQYPTSEGIDAAIVEALKRAKEQIGDDVRLLTRPEFQQAIIAERTGVNERFACPDNWERRVSIETAFEEWRRTLKATDNPSNQCIFGQGYVAGWNAKEATRPKEGLR